jgi:hypothetical protein
MESTIFFKLPAQYIDVKDWWYRLIKYLKSSTFNPKTTAH